MVVAFRAWELGCKSVSSQASCAQAFRSDSFEVVY